MVCLWLGCAPAEDVKRVSRTQQWVALALLLLVLFPVISVTDDLMAAENPAETDSIQRRDHEAADLCTPVSFASCPPESAALVPAALPCRFIGIAELRIDLPSAPALSPIENRPPPVA